LAIDAWFPVGFKIADQAATRAALFGEGNWQIVEVGNRRRALVVADETAKRWLDVGLIEAGQFDALEYGGKLLWVMLSNEDQVLCPVSEGNAPNNVSEALSFATALRASRSIDRDVGLQDALYVEKISRLLPTYTISATAADDLVLGYWLTGGANVSAKSFRRLCQSVSYIDNASLRKIVQTAGIAPIEHRSFVDDRQAKDVALASSESGSTTHGLEAGKPELFEIAGRPELTDFFNEHVIDIVQNRDRYSALGISFPSPIVLHGPPGCGKTFAVERLVEYLGWPSFQIDASSVASPYIHETSKKVAQVFEKAGDNSPSVLIIDEMEAFLADRDMGEGHHRVEEVAEFLRRIPEAAANDVLIIAMTNRVDMIDPAVLRRGRFDHVIGVNFATGPEVLALLRKLLSALPTEGDLQLGVLVEELVGRPLSDVSFVVREAARLSAREGRTSITQESLIRALRSAPAREREGSERRKIGFG